MAKINYNIFIYIRQKFHIAIKNSLNARIFENCITCREYKYSFGEYVKFLQLFYTVLQEKNKIEINQWKFRHAYDFRQI